MGCILILVFSRRELLGWRVENSCCWLVTRLLRQMIFYFFKRVIKMITVQCYMSFC